MQKLNLYRIKTETGVIDTLKKPKKGVEYTLRYRLVADDGMALTNGLRITQCVDIDVEQLEEWREIEYTPPVNE